MFAFMVARPHRRATGVDVDEDGFVFDAEVRGINVDDLFARVALYVVGLSWEVKDADGGCWRWDIPSPEATNFNAMVRRLAGVCERSGHSLEAASIKGWRLVWFRGSYFDTNGSSAEGRPARQAAISVWRISNDRTELTVSGHSSAGPALLPVVEKLAHDFPDVAAALAVVRGESAPERGAVDGALDASGAGKPERVRRGGPVPSTDDQKLTAWREWFAFQEANRDTVTFGAWCRRTRHAESTMRAWRTQLKADRKWPPEWPS